MSMSMTMVYHGIAQEIAARAKDTLYVDGVSERLYKEIRQIVEPRFDALKKELNWPSEEDHVVNTWYDWRLDFAAWDCLCKCLSCC